MSKTMLDIEEYKKLKRVKNKYGAVKTVIDDISFDSKKEAARYFKLKMLKMTGEVLKIELQPKFPIIVNGINCGFYKADFRVTWKSGNVTIEDVKGMKTPVYNLKKRLVEAIYGIAIIEK